MTRLRRPGSADGGGRVVPVELILFDLDGTLVDSLEDVAASMNEVLRSMGHPPHPTDSYRRFVGDGVVTLARRALPPAASDEAAVCEATRRMKDVYARRWLDTTRPYPGVPELLAELRRREVRTAVLSNKPDDATRHVVGVLFPDHPFDRVRGKRPGSPLKPDPAAALEICAELGVAPQGVLYLGDSDTDIATGLNAGFRTVGAGWGFRGGAELVAAGAASVIDHPHDLLRLIDSVRDAFSGPDLVD